jgi:hypothetical protein
MDWMPVHAEYYLNVPHHRRVKLPIYFGMVAHWKLSSGRLTYLVPEVDDVREPTVEGLRKAFLEGDVWRVVCIFWVGMAPQTIQISEPIYGLQSAKEQMERWHMD